MNSLNCSFACFIFTFTFFMQQSIRKWTIQLYRIVNRQRRSIHQPATISYQFRRFKIVTLKVHRIMYRHRFKVLINHMQPTQVVSDHFIIIIIITIICRAMEIHMINSNTLAPQQHQSIRDHQTQVRTVLIKDSIHRMHIIIKIIIKWCDRVPLTLILFHDEFQWHDSIENYRYGISHIWTHENQIHSSEFWFDLGPNDNREVEGKNDSSVKVFAQCHFRLRRS